MQKLHLAYLDWYFLFVLLLKLLYYPPPPPVNPNTIPQTSQVHLVAWLIKWCTMVPYLLISYKKLSLHIKEDPTTIFGSVPASIVIRVG